MAAPHCWYRELPGVVQRFEHIGQVGQVVQTVQVEKKAPARTPRISGNKAGEGGYLCQYIAELRAKSE